MAKCIRSKEEDNDLEAIMFAENLSDRSVFIEAEDFIREIPVETE